MIRIFSENSFCNPWPYNKSNTQIKATPILLNLFNYTDNADPIFLQSSIKSNKYIWETKYHRSTLVSNVMFFSSPKFRDFNGIALVYSVSSQTTKSEYFMKIVLMIPEPTIIQIPRQINPDF